MRVDANDSAKKRMPLGYDFLAFVTCVRLECAVGRFY